MTGLDMYNIKLKEVGVAREYCCMLENHGMHYGLKKSHDRVD